MNKILLLTFLFLYPCTLHCQAGKESTDEDYVVLRNKYVRNENNLSPSRISAIGDSLYRKSNTNVKRANALLIQIMASSSQKEADKSIFYAQKLDSIAVVDKMYDYRIKANGVMASMYRHHGLFTKSNEKLDLILDLIKKTHKENTPLYSTTLLELGTNYFSEKNYNKAKYFLQKSLTHFKKENNYEEVFFIQTIGAKMMLGNTYRELNQFEEAEVQFKSALKQYDKFSHNKIYKTQILTGLGKTYIKQGKYDLAYTHLTKAKELAKDRNDSYEINEIQKAFEDYYTKIDKPKSADSVRIHLLDEAARNEKTILKVANKALTENKIKIEEQSDTIRWVSVVAAFFIISTIVFIFIKRREKIVKEIHFVERIKEIEKNSAIEENQKTSLDRANNLDISSGKEAEIVEGLNKFEKQNKFTDNISLASMASMLNTNTKYLSFVLEKHRQSTFTDYINYQRIDYITKKLYNDPDARKFKISYLAELCGFSSHSYFAKVFKKEMKISPSEFIDKLNEREVK
ncbi:tetratricopeptide repeat protein [Chryseobacterium sp. POL2]|uniref:AraC family transcriptional regulator n=1 Tax=Chryseobacterium sp. POL2 TaxID=2713414 RepID=UPI0013E206F4|nr:AraC family transcriptional regulator [Chryseobacterium sp. POL2]QIG89342.1 tetratricopeptide repeat protein [Chryseobacterium sp. POL2]